MRYQRDGEAPGVLLLAVARVRAPPSRAETILLLLLLLLLFAVVVVVFGRETFRIVVAFLLVMRRKSGILVREQHVADGAAIAG